MKLQKTSIELTEEQLAIKAFHRKQREILLGNDVCYCCGGTGLDDNKWICGTCDGHGVVYNDRE